MKTLMSSFNHPISLRKCAFLSFAFFIIFTSTGCDNDEDVQEILERLAVSWNAETGNSGEVDLMNTRRPWSFSGRPFTTDANSFLHFSQGKLYVVSRSEGTVRVIDINDGSEKLIASLGTDSEPQDIAVINSETAYLTLRNATHLLRLNLNNGETAEAVDLSEFADSDGIPDLGTMIIHEGRLFVQIRRANEDLPGFVRPSYIAVVNPATEQLVDADPELPGVQAIELEGTAPKNRMQVIPEARRLFVSATGGSFDDGGIEVIDLDELKSLGLVLRESDGNLGADVGAFIMVTPDRGYVVVTTDLELSSHLTPFSIPSGAEDSDIYSSNGHFAPVLEYDSSAGLLFFPDGAFGSLGIHVFDVSTNERLTPAPISTAGPPSDILLLPTSMEKDFDFSFEEGLQGWTGDFSDYPVGEEALYELNFEHAALPEPLDTSGKALKISGKNHSDDLFMFIKRKITGLDPRTTYHLTFNIKLATDAPDSGAGTGGDPAIPLKVGATIIEPNKIALDNFYQMNIDKGNQELGGGDMVTIGDTGNGTEDFQYVLVEKNNDQAFEITTDEEGGVWVIIGTDSDFESTTTLFYDSVHLKFER